MKNDTKHGQSAKNGQFVLTSKRGEKFSAVEGLSVSKRMDTVVRETSSGRYLTSDERRTIIKETLRKK